MSEQNVELHRRVMDAFNRRDIEELVTLCDPSIEWHSVFAAVGGGVYHGHDEMRRYFQDLEDTLGGDSRIEPEAYFDLGDHTLVFYVAHAYGKQSGAEVATPAAAVARWRGGLIVHYKANLHKDDALKDLGVSEDALEPIAP